jgi:hypothetical protein
MMSTKPHPHTHDQPAVNVDLHESAERTASFLVLCNRGLGDTNKLPSKKTVADVCNDMINGLQTSNKGPVYFDDRNPWTGEMRKFLVGMNEPDKSNASGVLDDINGVPLPFPKKSAGGDRVVITSP